MGCDGAEVRATRHGGLTPSQVVYHAASSNTRPRQASRSRAWSATKDTGRPVAGVDIRAAVYDEHSVIPDPGIEATTDDRGHYRLVGLPRAPAYRIFIEPGSSGPYTKAALRAAGDTPAFEPVTFDINLKRGILVRGKVTDKATGQPVVAMVDVFAFTDNPHVREFPGFRSSALARSLVIDGRYEIVALPGRCIIAAVTGGYVNRYRRSVGAETIKGDNPIKGYNPVIAFSTFPAICVALNYNVLAEINLDPKAETAELDLQVDAGRTITVNPVDSEGHPVAGTTASGVSDESSEYPQAASTIEILALDPSQPRRDRHARRPETHRIGLPQGGRDWPLTIRLQPYGTITGRIVDEEGRPRGRLGITSAGGSMPERPAEQGILPGGNYGGGIRMGRDGRFRIEGLVPGLKYGAGASEGFNIPRRAIPQLDRHPRRSQGSGRHQAHRTQAGKLSQSTQVGPYERPWRIGQARPARQIS